MYEYMDAPITIKEADSNEDNYYEVCIKRNGNVSCIDTCYDAHEAAEIAGRVREEAECDAIEIYEYKCRRVLSIPMRKAV